MLKQIQAEIKKLPQVMTRQQVLNWYIDNIGHRWGSQREITTGEVIILIENSGREVKGQSELAIHITPEEEREFILRAKMVGKRKNENSGNIIPDSEKETIRKMYWDKAMSLETIAKRYSCSESTVQKRMKDLKIKTRTRGSSILTSTKSRGIRVGV